MESYINILLDYYQLNERYSVEQEYDSEYNIYYVSIYTHSENPVLLPQLPQILLEHHEEFILNLDKIITRVYPDYERNSLTVHYFTSKIWIAFIPVILDLYVITEDAKTSRDEYLLKRLISSIEKAAKGRYQVHHYIFYNPQEQHIKRFYIKNRRYIIHWRPTSSRDPLVLPVSDDDIIAVIPMASFGTLKEFPVQILDLFESKIDRVELPDGPNGPGYITRYKYLKKK